MAHVEPIYFDRSRIRMHVEQRVRALQKGFRQNIGLIGREGLGKTHLLSSLRTYLRESCPEVLVAAVEMEFLRFDQFANRWIGSVLSALFPDDSDCLAEDLNRLLDRAAAIVPQSVEKAVRLQKTIFRGEWNSAAIRELFAFSGFVAEESGKKIVLILDEFQALEYLPSADPFAIFGKEIMVQKETLYLVSSSRPDKAREIFSEKLSMLFGNFEVIEMAAFGCRETESFLRISQPGFAFTREQIAMLVRLTGGVPNYLELIIEQLGSLYPVSHHRQGDDEQRHAVPSERLLRAIEREMFDDRGRLALLFEKKLQGCRRFAKDCRPYIQALLAISLGRKKLVSIASYMDRKVREAKKIVERLVEEDLIVKRGAFYLIEDDLFSFWLREIYSLKIQSLGMNELPARERFLNLLQTVLKDSSRENPSYVLELVEKLFHEFRNDLVEINQRPLRLPQFHEVTFRPSAGRFVSLLGRKTGGKWFCTVAMDPVIEEDILVFAEEVRKSRVKVQKKIIFALGGIEQNAKLMAQEARIQLLDLKNLNTLLQLYNFPQLILAGNQHGPIVGSMAESLHSS